MNLDIIIAWQIAYTTRNRRPAPAVTDIGGGWWMIDGGTRPLRLWQLEAMAERLMEAA